MLHGASIVDGLGMACPIPPIPYPLRVLSLIDQSPIHSLQPPIVLTQHRQDGGELASASGTVEVSLLSSLNREKREFAVAQPLWHEQPIADEVLS